VTSRFSEHGEDETRCCEQVSRAPALAVAYTKRRVSQNPISPRDPEEPLQLPGQNMDWSIRTSDDDPGCPSLRQRYAFRVQLRSEVFLPSHNDDKPDFQTSGMLLDRKAVNRRC